ncbi:MULTISPECIES: amidohydrolase [unclassified Ruegeria]|uniref:amidohydrolase n=1 Tax=unclassified Ruegeria TaxID=2625375 RepID=UPI001491FC07|nr:amidohydrolase [Ruegeria sp. HKCCD4318]NOE12754.1 amidohydrolase [Ruegeria sp. HKCCD4318-2]NOG09080.1 amidohydrolase [Ruegeria sp. HKCCD4315]
MTPDLVARLTRLRRELHQNPELSGQEVQTAARVADLLREAGADRVLTGIGGHGVAGVFESGQPGPTLAIRCELDGLPIQEVADLPYVSQTDCKGHLCGHDGHMTMVLGIADALGHKRPNSGRVVLIFQPAEETGQGAVAFRADPQFAGISPDIVLSLHNLPGLELGAVELCTGPANCASRGMQVVLTGKTSHAAAPQDGVSPAGALAKLMPALADLGAGGDLNDDYALTTVTHANLGERTVGVAPGRAELWVTLRTVSDRRMTRLIDEAEAMVHKTAQDEGLSVEISYDEVFEACVNHPETVSILKRSCVDQGIKCRLVDQPQRFSEDFGQFGKCANAAMFWLGSGRDHPQLHNPDYDFPDALIPVGVGIFLNAIDATLGRRSSV